MSTSGYQYEIVMLAQAPKPEEMKYLKGEEPGDLRVYLELFWMLWMPPDPGKPMDYISDFSSP